MIDELAMKESVAARPAQNPDGEALDLVRKLRAERDGLEKELAAERERHAEFVRSVGATVRSEPTEKSAYAERGW